MKKISNIASISAFALMAMTPQLAYSQTADERLDLLEPRVDNLVATVNDVDTGVAALNTRAGNLEATVNDVDTGVAALNTRAGNLEATVNDADTGVVALNSRLHAEALTRAADDLALSDRITEEANTRADHDQLLSDRITEEANTRADHDQLLSDRITAEANTRAAADTTLANSAADALGGGAAYDVATGKISKPSYTIQGATATGVEGAMEAIDAVLTDHNTRLGNLDTKVVQLENQQELYNRQANGGIAAAMALGGAMIVPDSTVSVNFNIATYRGEQGFAGNLTVRASERVYFNGGVVGSTVRGSTGGRVGVAFGF